MSCPRDREPRGFYAAQVFGPDADGPACVVVAASDMSDEHAGEHDIEADEDEGESFP